MKHSKLFLLSAAVLFVIGFSGCKSLTQHEVKGTWVVESVANNANQDGPAAKFFNGWSEGITVSFTADSMYVDAALGGNNFTYSRAGGQLYITPRETEILGVEIERSERKQMEKMPVPFSFEGDKLVLGNGTTPKRIVLYMQNSK